MIINTQVQFDSDEIVFRSLFVNNRSHHIKIESGLYDVTLTYTRRALLKCQLKRVDIETYVDDLPFQTASCANHNLMGLYDDRWNDSFNQLPYEAHDYVTFFQSLRVSCSSMNKLENCAFRYGIRLDRASSNSISFHHNDDHVKEIIILFSKD